MGSDVRQELDATGHANVPDVNALKVHVVAQAEVGLDLPKGAYGTYGTYCSH